MGLFSFPLAPVTELGPARPVFWVTASLRGRRHEMKESARRKGGSALTGKGSNQSKIDYQLLARRKVTDSLLLLADPQTSRREKEAALRRLVRLGRYTVPVCIDHLARRPGSLDVVIAQVFRALDDPSCLEELAPIMLDSRIPDETKAALLPVFQHYGVDMEAMPWQDLFQDAGRVARRELLRLLDLAAADQNITQQILDELDRMPPDGKLVYTRYLAESRSVHAVPFLAALAWNEDAEIALSAVDGLASIPALSAQRELQALAVELPPGGRVHEAAVRALAARGEGWPVTSSSQPEVRLDQAAVSAVDGAGNRAIWLAYGEPGHSRRPWRGLYLLVHDENGISLCFGTAATRRSTFRQMVRQLRQDTAVLVDDGEYAAALVQDALWRNRRSGNPVPVSFHYWRRMLGLVPFKPYPYTPRFSRRERAEAQEEIGAAQTRRLLEYHEFADWFLVEPAVYDWADRIASRGAPADTVRALLTPSVVRWRRRLALMADFYRRAGKRERFKLALATWLHFRPGQLESLPFAVRLIGRSLEVARGNMREGFDPRLLPEAFGGL